MIIKTLGSLVFLAIGLLFTTTPVLGAEPTEEMRAFAHLSALVETQDQKGFCTTVVAATSYADYVRRVCQLAIQNKLRKVEDCTPENIAREITTDTNRCLSMSAVEFKKSTAGWAELREDFIRRTKSKGIDGEKLLQEERAKLH